MTESTEANTDAAERRAALNAEMERTAFLKKAVSRKSDNETLEDAIAFFKARGYRAGRTGRPRQMYIMGGRDGILPRVTAEIMAQPNVGKAKATMLTISGFGEELGKHLQDYVDHLRTQRREA
jgi:hypothetical protein